MRCRAPTAVPAGIPAVTAMRKPWFMRGEGGLVLPRRRRNAAENLYAARCVRYGGGQSSDGALRRICEGAYGAQSWTITGDPSCAAANQILRRQLEMQLRLLGWRLPCGVRIRGYYTVDGLAPASIRRFAAGAANVFRFCPKGG